MYIAWNDVVWCMNTLRTIPFIVHALIIQQNEVQNRNTVQNDVGIVYKLFQFIQRWAFFDVHVNRILIIQQNNIQDKNLAWNGGGMVYEHCTDYSHSFKDGRETFFSTGNESVV